MSNTFFNNNIPLSAPNNPTTGSFYYNQNTGSIFVYVGNKWIETYMSKNKDIKQVSSNSFTCRTKDFSKVVDERINQIGLVSIKKSRRFNQSLYTMEDDTEVEIGRAHV